MLSTFAFLVTAPLLLATSPRPSMSPASGTSTVTSSTVDCRLFAERPLYTNAIDQRIPVRQEGTCDAQKLQGTLHLKTQVTDGTREFYAQLTKDDNTLFLRPDPLTSALPEATGTFDVSARDGSPVARMALAIVPLTIEASHRRRFFADSLALQGIEETQPGVPDQLAADSSTTPRVYNDVRLAMPRDFDWDVPDASWRVILPSPLQLCEQNTTVTCRPTSQPPPVASPQSLSIRATRSVSTELRVDLRLCKQTDPRCSAPLLRLAVTVAKGASMQSIHLPIERIAYAKCEARPRSKTVRVVRGEETLDVARRSLRARACKLLITEDLLLATLAEEHGLDLPTGTVTGDETNKKCTPDDTTKESLDLSESSYILNERCIAAPPSGSNVNEVKEIRHLYGAQHLLILVVPEGADKPQCTAETYDPVKRDRRTEYTLPIDPKEILDPSQTYTVRLARGKSCEEATTTDGIVVGRLRSRGAFGWPTGLKGNSLRAFVTVPANLGGILAPASARDLRSSEDTTALQLTTLSTGALLVFEPWNYRDAENPVPTNLSIVLPGLVLRSFSTDPADLLRVRPLLVSGLQIKLPLSKGKNQRDIDLALGVYYAYDLRVRDPSVGSHAMVTLGLDLLSLFGPASDDDQEAKTE